MTNSNTAAQNQSLQQWLEFAAHILEQSNIFLGHGADNYWDEAVFLSLPSLGVPFDADRAVLEQSLDSVQRSELEKLLQQRIEQRIPVPYLTGVAGFAGLSFSVNRSVLIPRSPMAELIERQFRPWCLAAPKAILDLCCGGGCIGIACAEHLPEAQVDLADLSSGALAIAAKNIQDFQLESRVHCYQGDLFKALSAKQSNDKKNSEQKKYDLIISNPPYVDKKDMDSLPAEYLHEPRLALAAGEDGLDLVKKILAAAAEHLTKDGLLIVEVGNSQAALEQQYPEIPFTWLEFERGGEGVFLLTRKQLEKLEGCCF